MTDDAKYKEGDAIIRSMRKYYRECQRQRNMVPTKWELTQEDYDLVVYAGKENNKALGNDITNPDGTITFRGAPVTIGKESKATERKTWLMR